MIEGRKVITLCGSSKFKQDFERVNRQLTLQGNVVITLAFFGHADNIPVTPEQKRLVDEIHLRKIDLSDSIYVINKEGYVGESTTREIEYAKANGKQVAFMEPRNRSLLRS
jgi:hypothetical protein